MKLKRVVSLILSAALTAACLNVGFAAEAEDSSAAEAAADESNEDSNSDENYGSGTNAEAQDLGSGELDGYIGPELGEVEYTAADDEEEVVNVYEDVDITPFAESLTIGTTEIDSIEIVGSSVSISAEEYTSADLSDGLTGLGTEDEPYLIYTEDELSQIAAETITNASSAYYQLQNDITITTETWNPIGSISGFTGVFDGNGYTITGSTTFESTGMSGLFATNSGTIKNLNVNLTIGETATIAGLLVGVNSGSVSGCTSAGSIASSSSVYVGGLVGQNSGTISDCSSTAAVSSAGSAGGLVGYSTGLVQNSNASGTVTSTGSHAGGLVGYLSTSGTVTGSYAEGDVTASDSAGGLIGYRYHNSSGNITSILTSYSTGNISGKYSGGLIGHLYDRYVTDTIKYCYSQGTVAGSSYSGGFIGYAESGNSAYINIMYCYATGVVNEGAGGGFAGYISDSDYIYIRYSYYNQVNEGTKYGFSTSLSRMKTSALYYGWNFDNYWNIDSGGYPYIDIRGTEISVEISGNGTASSPYIIENEEQLISLVNGSLSRAAYYQLGNDIAVTARHWTPIGGNGTTNFTGVFDGCGYTISGLKLSNSHFKYIGLFGVNEGTIKNLNVNATFEGVYDVGALAGRSSNGTYENCTAAGTITNVGSNGNYSGGLIGVNSSGSVNSCSSTATVTAAYGSAGGLLGYNTGSVKDSYSSSTVTSTNKDAGGLIGENSTSGTVEDCYATGAVTASEGAGGLIGYKYYNGSGTITTITKCYATGAVTGKKAGGFIGHLYDRYVTDTVKYSYARGTVTGSSYGGGFIGYTESGNSAYVNILYCYASGLVNSGDGGGFVGYLTDRNYIFVRYCYYLRSNTGNKVGFNTSASNLKKAATYYGWDFDNVWNISTSSVYPYIDIRGTYEGIEIEGFGEDDDPYMIENEDQLIAMVNGEIGPATKAYYELANDITVTASHWTPIGGNGTSSFNGVFDGAGHTISGLKLSNSHYGYIGLFGTNEGTIKNLNVNATFEGVYDVGVIAGWNSGTIENCTVTGTVTNVESDGNASGSLVGLNVLGNITNCSSSATVTAAYGTAGGLVGYNTGSVNDSYSASAVTSTNKDAGGLIGENNTLGTVADCYASGTVTAGEAAGGLIGYKYYNGSDTVNTVTRCYATGSATGKKAGGFIGHLYDRYVTDTINYCYAQGTVTGSSYGGGFIGYAESGNSAYVNILYCYASGLVNSGVGCGFVGYLTDKNYIYVRYCYYDLSNSGNKVGFGHTTSALKTADSYYGWNFENIWSINDGGYPYIDLRGEYYGVDIEGSGDDDDPYMIEDETQLIAMVNGEIGPNSKAYYELANDITITADLWTPIGGNGTGNFNGVFNGAGYTISGVKLSNSHYDYIGFFGRNEGTIKNLNLDVTFEGVYDVGGVAGWNSGTIENCTVKGTITSVGSNGNAAGGLVGLINSGTVSSCSSTATVTAAYGNAGGLVGYNSAGAVYDSYALGDAVSSNSNAGGLIGYSEGLSTVENSYATGDVSASENAGGLIGYKYYNGSSIYTSVSKCYASGDAIGKYAGGLIGRVYDRYTTDTINYCYALGSVSGTSYAGGLIGYTESGNSAYVNIIHCYSIGGVAASNMGGLIGYLSSTSYISVQSSYYNADTSGCSDIDKGASLSDASMKLQASYNGWDFDTVWAIDSSMNSGYPHLQALGAENTGSDDNDDTTTTETTTETTTSSSGSDDDDSSTSTETSTSSDDDDDENSTSTETSTETTSETSTSSDDDDNDDNTTTTETSTETTTEATVVDDSASQLKVSAPENAKLGNTVEVKLIMRNVDVISGGQFILNYDNTKVSLDSDGCSAGAVLSDNNITPVVNVNNDAGTCAVAFISNPTANFDAEGTLMTFTFTTIADGTAEFEVSSLSFSYKSGTKYIELDIASVADSTNITSYILGDVNDDNKINYLDAVVILRSAVGLVTLDETHQLAADVDGSGSVNYQDAMYILDYSAGNITSFGDL